MEGLIQNALEAQKEIQVDFKVGRADIKVVGVGGGGSNVTNWLHKKGIEGVKNRRLKCS